MRPELGRGRWRARVRRRGPDTILGGAGGGRHRGRTGGAGLVLLNLVLAAFVAFQLSVGPAAAGTVGPGTTFVSRAAAVHAAAAVPSAAGPASSTGGRAPAPAAPTTTTSTPPGASVPPAPLASEPATGPAPSVGNEALTLIGFPWTRLGYSLSFTGPTSGLLGLTTCATHSITIYVRPTQTVGQVAFVTAYEIAHAVDCTYNTAPTRARWAALRGFGNGVSWFPPCTCNEDDYGSGDFADVFATWQMGFQYQWRSALAPPPGPAEMSELKPYLEPPGS